MKEGEFPPHFIYGAAKLGDYGIDVVWHKSRIELSRWRMMIYNAWRILACRKRIDAVYATHYRGLEIIIFMRALGLFRKPIVIWHHQPIITPKSMLRELMGRLFYKGIDDMFFFSRKLMDDSLKTKKARIERMHLGHWGADLDFYDKILSERKERSGFISTGKEMRDMPTLIDAFNATGAPLDIYIARKAGDIRYTDILADKELKDNINLHYLDKLMPYEISLLVNKARCVVICCHETKYTVGLTTVVEALAMGIPVICSRNPQIPVDFEKERCGISVPYYDVDGWKRAIEWMMNNEEEAEAMGSRGRRLAEQMYNDNRCAKEVAEVLKKHFQKR